MMDINVKGLLYVTKAVLPQMIERNAGHIINIGSLAGKEVYPRGNVYCASKHAVGYEPLKASDIAEIIHFVVTRPSHVNIADLLVLPAAQASSSIVKKEL